MSISQEDKTEWKGEKTKEIGDEYQMFYKRMTNGMNEVGVILDA